MFLGQHLSHDGWQWWCRRLTHVLSDFVDSGGLPIVGKTKNFTAFNDLAIAACG
jgi:hypothetical protein